MAAQGVINYHSATIKQMMVELRGVNWSSLGDQLGIPECKKRVIEQSYSNNQLQLMEVLGWWIDNDSNVTWTRLAVALDKMHLYDLKERILWKYCPIQSLERVSSTDGRDQGGLVEKQEVDAPHIFVDEDIMEQLADLKYSFSNLTGDLDVLIEDHLMKNIFKRRRRQLKVISILTTFLDVNHHSDEWSLSQLLKKLAEMNDIFQVKTFQRFFRSYFKNHPSSRMASMNYIASHQQKINKFEESVKFMHLKECVQDVQPRLSDFDCLTLILSDNWSDCYVSQLRKLLYKVFNIHEAVLLNIVVRRGSVIVEFEFPAFLNPIMVDHVLKNTDVLQSNNVLKLMIGGKVYFQKTDETILGDDVSLGFIPDISAHSPSPPLPLPPFQPPLLHPYSIRSSLPTHISLSPQLAQHYPIPEPQPVPKPPAVPKPQPVPKPRAVPKPLPVPKPHRLLRSDSPFPVSFADNPLVNPVRQDIALETQNDSRLSLNTAVEDVIPQHPLYGRIESEGSTAIRYSSTDYPIPTTRHSTTGYSSTGYSSTGYSTDYSSIIGDSRRNTGGIFSQEYNRNIREKGGKHETSNSAKAEEEFYVPYVALKDFKDILLSERTMFRDQMELQNELILELKEEVKFLREDSLLKQQQIFSILEKTKEEPQYSHVPDIERSIEPELIHLPLSSMDRREACPICFDEANPVKMITIPGCGHMICTQCFSGHFEERITSQNVRCFVCPVCGKPDIPQSNFPRQIHEYFISLSYLITKYTDEDIYSLFQKKLTEFYLSNAPQTYLIWCPSCYEPFVKTRLDCSKTQCPSCEKYLCPHCKKEMTKKEKTCLNEQCGVVAREESQKRENKSIDQFIDQTMIECPSCSGKFSLDSSGCDHLQCVQCSHEFCRCCGKPYHHGNKCTQSKSCKMKGLHAHHPRNCVYYLRDIPIHRLEGLLAGKNKFFGWDDQEMEDDLSGRCFWGRRDIQCERLRSEDNHGPLCLFHYKDYLISRIRNEGLDPADIFDIDELKKVLQREDLSSISNTSESNEEAFLKELIEYVKISVPLDSSSATIHQPREAQQEKGCNVM